MPLAFSFLQFHRQYSYSKIIFYNDLIFLQFCFMNLSILFGGKLIELQTRNRHDIHFHFVSLGRSPKLSSLNSAHNYSTDSTIRLPGIDNFVASEFFNLVFQQFNFSFDILYTHLHSENSTRKQLLTVTNHVFKYISTTYRNIKNIYDE